MIFHQGWVCLQPLPDDFRCAPLDYNLKQKLIIPDCAREPSRLSKVLALGEGQGYIYSVAVGDIVLSTRYPKSCQNFKWGDEMLVIVREEEILAKVVNNGSE